MIAHRQRNGYSGGRRKRKRWSAIVEGDEGDIKETSGWHLFEPREAREIEGDATESSLAL